MKNLLACLLFVATFIQCTTEENIENQTTEQNLAYEQGLNLSTAIPLAALDTKNQGLYVGTLVTNDLSFHEKIFINVNNDGHINAQIPTTNLDIHSLKGERIGKKTNTYFFSGNIGSFNLTLKNNQAIITNATFDNKDAVVNVLKSTSEQRRMPSLGTFVSNDATLTGTWDLSFVPTTPNAYFISTLTIVKDGGSSSFVNVTGDYAYMCNPSDNPETYMNQIAINCSGSAPFIGKTLDYNLIGFYSQEDPACMTLLPNDINIFTQSWSLGTQEGTITIDVNSLPIFTGGVDGLDGGLD